MDLKNTTIGEIVTADYRAADIFKKYEIDFCCGGNKSISEVCENQSVNVEALMEDLDKTLNATKGTALPYDEWPLDLLAAYIQKKHHRYVEDASPVLKSYLAKIVQVHGRNHPELEEVASLFLESVGELTMHMKKEELMLFPYVEKLVNLKAKNVTDWEKPVFGSIANPVRQMEEEHEGEGERFRKIARLTNNYTPPADACNTYRVTFQKLKEFEEDLHLHVHLENNILFPKAIALEQSMAETVKN